MHRGSPSAHGRCAAISGSTHQDGSAFPGRQRDGRPRASCAEELRKKLGQPVIIENLTGADGQLAAQAVKRAAPDGYTIFLSTNSTHAANLSLFNTLQYDPEKDFVPIAGMIRIPMIMMVHKDFPADDVAVFVKVAGQRTATKPLTYGSGNAAGHIAAELLKAATKVDMVHVQYRGSPQALQDLVGGHVDLLFGDPLHVDEPGERWPVEGAGRRRRRASSAPCRRCRPWPRQASRTSSSWRGPPFLRRPPPTLRSPAGSTRRSTRSSRHPEIIEALQKMAMTPMIITPGELSSFVRSEIVRWKRNVELAGIAKK